MGVLCIIRTFAWLSLHAAYFRPRQSMEGFYTLQLLGIVRDAYATRLYAMPRTQC